MPRIIDLSPPVPHGFMGPPSTNLGVQVEVRTKPGYWQSGSVAMSLRTGRHVESALHCIEDGEPIEAVTLHRVIGSGVVLDLTPVEAEALIDVADLERAASRCGGNDRGGRYSAAADGLGAAGDRDAALFSRIAGV